MRSMADREEDLAAALMWESKSVRCFVLWEEDDFEDLDAQVFKESHQVEPGKGNGRGLQDLFSSQPLQPIMCLDRCMYFRF